METLSPPPLDIGTSFRAAMRRLTSTVTIVTASDGTRRHGMTMTAVNSLSMDPPSLIVCANQSTLLHDILLSARSFCVNILKHDQASVSTAFSGAASPEDRFFTGDWAKHAAGVDYLASAQVNIFCRKVAAVPFGTHTIFIGTAEEVLLNDDSNPLLYRNASYC
ncbi:flavin reductase family protein [Burkholderia seminalis]|uniref:flavin reductase family protein n=1 Tax=Burkholderia seminalis TaxID=488731 RepID=UPI0009EBA404|nr:flavin reductase family protein [Burkholderia seminalis]MCA8039839.1 flavin reductase family protein [Burkholderia seminalis]